MKHPLTCSVPTGAPGPADINSPRAADCTPEEVRIPAAFDRGSKTAFERTPSLTHTPNGHSHAHRHRFARAQVQEVVEFGHHRCSVVTT